jgi:hypothetical protein
MKFFCRVLFLVLFLALALALNPVFNFSVTSKKREQEQD